MKIGEKLSFLRKQHGMTQMELAERLDISRQTISKWECGAALPSAENLNGIGRTFNVSIDALMDESVEFLENTAVAVAIAENPEIFESKRKKLRVRNLGVLVIAIVLLTIVVSVCTIGVLGVKTPEDRPIHQEDMTPEYLDPSEVTDGASGWRIEDE